MSFLLNISKTVKPLSRVRTITTVKYTPEHEWVKVDDKDPSIGVIGISKFCADQMKEVIHVSHLPQPGAKLTKQNDRIASVESYKAEIDFASPVSGTVLEVDQQVSDNPFLVANSPTSDGWLLKVKLANTKELDDLMNEEDYKRHCTEIELAPGNTGFDEYL